MNYQKILLDNVPRFIEHIKKRGGVHPQEWEWIKLPRPAYAEVGDFSSPKT